MMIIFYSTNCPKCKVLKTKLDKTNIQYTVNENIDEMLQLGIQSVPALQIDDVILDFGQAVKWLKENYN